ncbi:MAG TPA: HEAT repeat domain-containing protein [Geothrix sp.]
MSSGRGPGQDLSSVVGQVQAFLGSLTAGGQAAADMSGLADYLEGMGLDRQGQQPGTQGVISRAVSSLPPREQLGVLMGSGALRSGPLRNVFSRLSTTLAARTMASAVSTGELTTQQFIEAADQMKAIMPSTQSWVEQITEALRHEGMSEGQLKALLDILTWESRPLEERIKALLEGQRIFEMPAEKVLAFLRELLEAGRNTEFLRLVRHFASGLQVPAVARRLAVAQSFEKIADWVDIPGMPPHIMEELMGILSRAYGREKDPEVHRWLSLGVEHILWFFMESRDPLRTCSLLESLQDVVTELSLPAEWKELAMVELLQRLGTPERLDKILSQLFDLEPQDAVTQVHPLFAMLGPSAASYLVERLSQESDRNLRRRLMDALKACGHNAEAPLLESLKSSDWFVVRNALIVLGEVASPGRVHELEPFLDHKDARVRLAAVRALGHLGGRDAETTLARLLSRPDSELQLEVLFILDDLKVRNAIPALMDLLKAGKTRSRSRQDKVREKAVEVLGHLGSHTVIPVLAKLLTRQKGFFRDTREALPIRIEALRALHSLGSVESREAIKKALASEPAGPELEVLKGALN